MEKEKDEWEKETMLEFDNKQRRFLGGLYHSTQFNKWFEKKLQEAKSKGKMEERARIKEIDEAYALYVSDTLDGVKPEEAWRELQHKIDKIKN